MRIRSFLLVMVVPWSAAQSAPPSAGMSWHPEPRYVSLSVDRVTTPPTGILEGNANVRLVDWDGFRSRDPRLYRIRRYITAGFALLTGGGGLRFVPPWGVPSQVPHREIRAYDPAVVSPYFEAILEADQGVFPPYPEAIPRIEGYTHQISAWVESNRYLGLWRRNGVRGSLVAAYLDRSDAPPPIVLGRSPIHFTAIAAYIRLHGMGPFGFVLTNEARRREPVYLVRYQWSPEHYRSSDSN